MYVTSLPQITDAAWPQRADEASAACLPYCEKAELWCVIISSGASRVVHWPVNRIPRREFMIDSWKRAALVLPLGAVLIAAAARADDADTEFFEKQVRPLLVARCQQCHGEKKQEGGLRLDYRKGW